MEQQPKLYNFSDLTPEVQRWLYKRIYAFDLACDCIALQKDEIVTSVRLAILMRVYQTMEFDDRLNILHLEANAVKYNLPKGSFNGLTPAARWNSLMWARATYLAAIDCWSVNLNGETTDEVLADLLAATDRAMSDNTPEEIACYWQFIDRWEPRTPGKVEFDSYLSLFTEGEVA
jgi:hypothetical protein